MAMKLMTNEILKALPREAEVEDVETEERIVVVKFFHPFSNWRWYAVAGEQMADGDILFYGMTSNSDGLEWGYFQLRALESIPAQRDKMFRPCPAENIMSGRKY